MERRLGTRGRSLDSPFRANFARVESGRIPNALSMSEAIGIDSVFWERAMPKPYSIDLRGRVIEEVETGASRREAAERYGLSPSGPDLTFRFL